METSNGNLVVTRRAGEIVVIRHGGEVLLLQVASGTSLHLAAPLSFRFVRGELEGAWMPKRGSLGVTRPSGTRLIIDHDGETLVVTFNERTRVRCLGPLSFRILREELKDDEPMAA